MTCHPSIREIRSPNQTLNHSNIRTLLSRLHARLGDFWWYSLMIFVAARAADCLNVFVGLWLVPKYVPPSELGAVMPLTQFASFLAMPAAVFASTFRNELTGLATRQEFGKMKTLMRSVFIATAIFFFLAIIACHFLLPNYLERIRVAEGSLGMLVLVTSFLGAASPVYSNALQSLKKFKASSVISLIGAPIRFLTMIVMMPFRAISGYFVGQTSVPAFCIIASLIALRKELSVKAEPYWTKPAVKRFVKIYMIFGITAIFGALPPLVQATVLRQRLPEIESAAYYMITRFSDIANFVTGALTMTIFPFAAELAKNGANTNKIVHKAFIVTVLSNAALIILFTLLGQHSLFYLPNGKLYSEYWWAIPWIIAIAIPNAFNTLYFAAETSANRLMCTAITVPINIIEPLLLLLITGQGYYIEYLPDGIADLLISINITSLSKFLLWITIFSLIRSLIYLFHSFIPKDKKSFFNI